MYHMKKMKREQYTSAAIGLALLLALVLRSALTIYPHSGQDKSPLYGDYEAQRHWMEVTLNLPINTWYFNTSANDLLYWGLDYPPLTAYHSLLMGHLAGKINKSWVDLYESRGTQTPKHKQFMRFTALATDCLTFLPACVLFFYWGLPKLIQGLVQLRGETLLSPYWGLILMLVYPGLYLIDHGHFQYNCASLGLFVMSITCILRDYDKLASIYFCCALLYKQMELYHSLPIFCYLLGKCLSYRAWRDVVCQLFSLAVTVVVSFGVVLLPFLLDANPLAQLLQIAHRIFPVARGLFEDKVSNFWCLFSVIVKIQHLVPQAFLVIVSAIMTLLVCIPACILLVQPTTNRPLRKLQLLYSCVVCSLSFFLFSYQVHEKSILLVSVPVLLISPFLPHEAVYFGLVSTLSMWPLLVKDGLALPTLVFTMWFGLLGTSVVRRLSKHQRWFLSGSMTIFSAILILSLTNVPPPNLPYLYPLLCSVYSCLQFMALLVTFYWRLYQLK